MKILILGGGIAGSVAASYAAKNGIDEVVLLEKESSLGGLHQDIKIDDLHFDIGCFFYWPGHQVLETFPTLIQYMFPVENVCFLSLSEKGNLDYYPPTTQGYIRDWGVTNFTIDILGLILARIRNQFTSDKFQSLDEELKYYMGGFYEKMGLRNYIARLYGIDPSEISIEFSTIRLQFIKESFSFKKIFHKLSRLKFSSLNRYPIATTAYARPSGGFSCMYGHVEEKLRDLGVNIYFNANVKEIFLDKKEVIMCDGTIHAYDYLISSIPLPTFCNLSNISLSLDLKFKPLYSLFYELDSEPVPNCQALFNFSQRGLWKRITFHSSYYGSSNGRSYFVVESMPNNFQLNDDENTTLLDKDFRDTFSHTSYKEKIRSARLIGSQITSNAYPIYTKDFDSSVIDRLKQDLSCKETYIVGRQGEFNYCTSSDATISSINAIDKILVDIKKNQTFVKNIRS